MKNTLLLIVLTSLLLSAYAADTLSKDNVAKWLEKSESGLTGNVVSLDKITLDGGEIAYLAKLDSLDDMGYALVRPKLKQAKYLDDLSDDLFRSYNHNDIVLIPTDSSTVLVLEGGGSHQGYFMVSRKFVSFNGWKVNILHEGEVQTDNTGADECVVEKNCEISKTSYKVASKSPLVITETTLLQTGTLDKMSKKAPTVITTAIRQKGNKAEQAKQPVSQKQSVSIKTPDVMNFAVVGVKLNMTEEQAVKAIQSHWKIDKKSIEVKHPIMGMGAQILVSKKNQRLIINLNYPKVGNSKEPVVDTIFYKMPETPDNRKAMKKRALEKYGEPTGNSGSILVWCGEIKYSGCDLDTNAGLTLDGTKITVLGPTHETEIRERLIKQKSAKPEF